MRLYLRSIAELTRDLIRGLPSRVAHRRDLR